MKRNITVSIEHDVIEAFDNLNLNRSEVMQGAMVEKINQESSDEDSGDKCTICGGKVFSNSLVRLKKGGSILCRGCYNITPVKELRKIYRNDTRPVAEGSPGD